MKFSEMSQEELYSEMQRLLGESRKKSQAGFISEANMLEQKYYMAKSYAMDLNEIEMNRKYRIIGEEGLLHVKYLNGVFAWGTKTDSDEERAFPVGRLEIK